MSNDKDIVIETAKRPRRMPQGAQAPELPLDAPDYETFLQRLNQPSESNDTDDRNSRPPATEP